VKKLFLIGITIFAILLVLTSVVMIIQPGFIIRPLSSVTNTCYGGLQILISTASHVPGQEFFHGEATANMGAECFKIAWTEEDIENYLADGGDADDGVYGDIVIKSQSNTFHTKEIDQIVENYHIKSYKGYYVSCSNSDCRGELNDDGIGYRRVVGSNLGIGECHCIYTMERGTFAPFVSGIGETHFRATISIDGLGNKEISDETRDVAFGDKAIFHWQGSLLSTRTITVPFYFTPFREGNDYVLTDTSYSDFGNSETSVKIQQVVYKYKMKDFDDCIPRVYISDVKKCINAYYSKADELLDDKINVYRASDPIILDADFDVDEGDLVVELEPYSTSFQRFSFDINAAWLGIEYLVGKPRVTCPDDQEGFSGETREIDLGVKNVAGGTGVFALSLNCGTLSETISPDTVSLPSGDSKTIRATIKGTTTTTEKTDTCTFRAYAKKDPTQQHSCSFSYKTKPRDVCLPGERKCSTDKQNLLICNDEGTGYNEYPCVNNCIYDSSEGAKCAEDPSCREEEETCTEDKDCCSGLECRGNLCKPIKPGWQWDNLYFLPILLTLGLAGLFGWMGKTRTGKYYWLDLTIGGIIGLIVGLVAYWILSNWVMVLLIGFIGGGGALALILFVGGIPLLLTLFSMTFRRKK